MNKQSKCKKCENIQDYDFLICQTCGEEMPEDSFEVNDEIKNEITMNTSGQGEKVQPPAIIKGWNWGAFFFGFIWGIFYIHSLKLLIFFIPIVGRIVGGKFGNQWAWQDTKWNNIMSFRNSQNTWAAAGIAFYSSIIIFFIFAGLVHNL